MPMKKKSSILMHILLLVILPGIMLEAADSTGSRTPIQMKGRLEVQFESGINPINMAKGLGRIALGVSSLDMIFEKYAISEASPLFPWRQNEPVKVGQDNLSHFYELIFPEETNINNVIQELLADPNIRSVAPIYAIPVDISSNDPNVSNQWGLGKVMAQSAWNMEVGSDTAVIALIDTGVLYKHPDLVNKIWVNRGEDLDNDGVVYDIDDLNGIDDDGNGVVDDLIGYDFFNGFSGISCWSGEDCGTPDTDPSDYNGHGTHCAGIAAAATNNSLGGAGLAGGWGGGGYPYRGPRIMCIRVGGSANDGGYEGGYVSTDKCAMGIDYAAKMGACVISCSWGSADSPAMQAACSRATDSGVVIVHAAGNDNSSTYDFLDAFESNGYPAALSVASTDGTDHKSSFSNYGLWVDVSAPGSNIYSTYSSHYTPGYAYMGGTSMAAPFVAGLAALIKSHRPDFKKQQIDSIIVNHADTIDYLNPSYAFQLGSGRINACSSLSIFPVAAFNAGPNLIGKAPLIVNFTDLSPVTPSAWNWDFGDGGTDNIQNPSHDYTEPGLYSVALTIDAPKGTITKVLKKLVLVTADTLKIDSINATAGSKVVVPVYLDNKFQAKSIILPIKIYGNYTITLDSFSIAGTRTDYFQDTSTPGFDSYGMRYAISLRPNTVASGGSRYLQPGVGLILNLHFTIPSGIGNELFVIDTITYTGRNLKLESLHGDYIPEFKAGKIYVGYRRGDANRDGKINLLDVSCIINALYRGGPAPDSYSGNADGIGGINLLDVSYIIRFLYLGGPPPPQ
jgi:subtilisin family serine protease